MSYLVGLEKEFFIKKITGIPNTDDENYHEEFISAKDANLSDACDECGYLAEARGEPKPDIIAALFSLKEKVFRIKKGLPDGIILDDFPFQKIPRKIMHGFQRQYGKNAAQDECMYGDIKMKQFQTAGLHVHFSSSYSMSQACSCGQVIKYNKSQQLNIPRIVQAFDTYFAKQIKEAKRQRGMYEMKPWGFEYRSLPANIPEKMLIEFMELSLKGGYFNV